MLYRGDAWFKSFNRFAPFKPFKRLKVETLCVLCVLCGDEREYFTAARAESAKKKIAKNTKKNLDEQTRDHR